MRAPSLPGLDIALRVNGQDLQEYEYTEEDGHEEGSSETAVTRYVEATSGANFSVEFSTANDFKHRHSQLELRVYLDGVGASGKVLHPCEYHGGHHNTSVASTFGHEGGQCVSRSFAFADLHTSVSSTFSVLINTDKS